MTNLDRADFSGPTVASALAEALSAVGFDLAIPDLAPNQLGLPPARKLCFILVDGLGAYQLRERSGHAPNLRRSGLDTDISSVIPSTTAAAITAVGTGQLPGRTSMAGYSMRSPNSGQLFSLIGWQEPGLEPAQWQLEPTIFERLGDQAERLALIQPRKFVGSGLTSAALRGARTIVAETLEQRVDAAVRALRNDVDACYLYWGDIDAAGHTYGWNSDAWISQLEAFDSEFGRLVRSLGRDTLVVLTADHGMIDVAERIDVAEHANLASGVDLVAGEPRAVQLYTSEPHDVARRWREHFADRVWLYTTDELIEQGMFGPVTEHTRELLGDVFVFSAGRQAIVDSRVQSAHAIGLIGVHGSLTNQEMRVPLVVQTT